MAGKLDEKASESKKSIMDEGARVTGYFVVKNDKGLHTRPCTELVKCSCGFQSQISLKFQKNRVNAKSLLGILMLAAPKGARVRIEAEGEDAAYAVDSLVRLANEKFNIQY